MADDRVRTYQPEPIRIGSVIADVDKHFAMMGCSDRLETVADRGILFFADAEMMVTILINLVDIALKYSPAPSRGNFLVGEERARLVIEVADRGMGIPERHGAKVGRRFFQSS